MVVIVAARSALYQYFFLSRFFLIIAIRTNRIEVIVLDCFRLQKS